MSNHDPIRAALERLVEVDDTVPHNRPGWEEEWRTAIAAARAALATAPTGDGPAVPEEGREPAAVADDSIELRAQRLKEWTETQRAALLDAFQQIDRLKERVDSHYLKIQKMEEATCDPAAPEDRSQLSDGFHTFAELYEHRHSLTLALMRALPSLCWFSERHSDGELPFGSADWFIVGVDLPTGAITYHLPMALLGLAAKTGAARFERGRAWDGHTADDVIQRLRAWATTPPPPPAEGEGLASDEGYESGAMWTGHPCRPTAPAEGEAKDWEAAVEEHLAAEWPSLTVDFPSFTAPAPVEGGGGMNVYPISGKKLDELQDMVSNDDALIAELIRLRGGCCCHLSAPCAACTRPLTAEEACDLGIYEDPTPQGGEVEG